jgi:hypothetical protein
MTNTAEYLHGACAMYLVDMYVALPASLVLPSHIMQIIYTIDLRTRQPRRRLRGRRGFAGDTYGLPRSGKIVLFSQLSDQAAYLLLPGVTI